NGGRPGPDDEAGAAAVVEEPAGGLGQEPLADRPAEPGPELVPALDLDRVVERPAVGQPDEPGDVGAALGRPARGRVEDLEVRPGDRVPQPHSPPPAPGHITLNSSFSTASSSVSIATSLFLALSDGPSSLAGHAP